MEWTELLPSVWQELAGKTAENPCSVPAEVIYNDNGAQYFACIFVSGDKTLHLLIEPEHPMLEKIIDPKAAGLTLKILTNHLVLGRERQDYIDIQCSAKPHLKAFTELVREICREVLCNGLYPSKAVNLVIRRWKSFWGKPAEQLLSEHEQMGLIAELLIVDMLLENGRTDVVEAWVGPDQFIHDFEFNRVSIEIKATTRPIHKHLINGIEQLQPSSGKQLLLVSFLAQRVSQGGISLADLVPRIIDRLDDCQEVYVDFTKQLSKTGFNLGDLSDYSHTRFIFADNKCFVVTEDFPCITHNSFSPPLSPRISDLKYNLSLEDMDAFSVDSKQFLEFFDFK